MSNAIAALEKMTDDQIGEFVQDRVKKSAVAIWETGKALAVAKQRLKGTDQWGKWLKTWFPQNERTAQRWMEVAEKLELKDIKEGQSVSSVYKLLAEQKREAKGAETTAVTIPRHGEVIEVTTAPADTSAPAQTQPSEPPARTPAPKSVLEKITAALSARTAPAAAVGRVPTEPHMERAAEDIAEENAQLAAVTEVMGRHGISGTPLAFLAAIEELLGIERAEIESRLPTRLRPSV